MIRPRSLTQTVFFTGCFSDDVLVSQSRCQSRSRGRRKGSEESGRGMEREKERGEKGLKGGHGKRRREEEEEGEKRRRRRRRRKEGNHLHPVRGRMSPVATWTHVQLQALRPLSNHAIARPTHVVPLVLKQVVASRRVTVAVERHRGTGTSCGGRKQTDQRADWDQLDPPHSLVGGKRTTTPMSPMLPIL